MSIIGYPLSTGKDSGLNALTRSSVSPIMVGTTALLPSLDTNRARTFKTEDSLSRLLGVIEDEVSVLPNLSWSRLGANIKRCDMVNSGVGNGHIVTFQSPVARPTGKANLDPKIILHTALDRLGRQPWLPVEEEYLYDGNLGGRQG